MAFIKQLSEINYGENPRVKFDATVVDLIAEGVGKIPTKATVKLEQSGELLQIFTWNEDAAKDFKEFLKITDIIEFTGDASLYKNEPQVKITNFVNTRRPSSIKIIKEVKTDDFQKEISSIIMTYIPTDHIYYTLLDHLLLKNDKFWRWPAATKMHHAYPGGLAKHTLHVCKNAIALWQAYQGSNVDIKALVAGALLHDIGKTEEYEEDGRKTLYGDMIPHPVSGYDQVFKEALSLGVNPKTDISIISLLHIILSHHGKLEFGSPVEPTILEAQIIYRSDHMDSTFEASDAMLDMLPVFAASERMGALNGGHVIKWHN